jgi:hypothetical protein
METSARVSAAFLEAMDSGVAASTFVTAKVGDTL